MAITTVTGNAVAGIKFTVIVDGSGDYASVANSTYFLDRSNSLVYYKNSSGTVTSLFGSSSSSTGLFAIRDSAGVPTFYTTLTLAMAAASSGQTIHFFADYSETGNVQVILKNGVNINGNGHTYTLSNAGNASALYDNNVGVTCRISDLKIIRRSATSSAYGILLSSSSSIIYGSNLIIDSDSGGIYNAGSFYNANVIHSNNVTFGVTNIGKIYYVTSIGSNGYPFVNNGSGEAYHCHGESIAGSFEGFTNNTTTSYAANCTGRSSSSTGFYNQGSMFNCTGISFATYGITSGTSAKCSNCTGYSSANFGIIGGEVYNSFGYSLTTSGIQCVKMFNCTSISLGSWGAIVSVGAYNSSIISRYNNSAGNAFEYTGAGPFEVTNCFLEVTNSSALCIHAPTNSTKYANNTFKGATIPVASNVQLIVNTMDNQGNILL